MQEEFVKNKSKERLLSRAKGLRQDMRLCESAARLIREDRDAVSENITIYDSLFVAASEREKVPLLTTDGKLHEKLNKKRNVKLI